MPKNPLSKSRFNPAPGIADLWNEFRRPNKYRWPILALSLVPVGLIMAWALDQEFYAPPERPRITYITTLEDGRSDAEIAAENAANQKIKDLRTAEEARLLNEKRKIYKALGKATGIDVDAIERKADAERAAEEAARKQRFEDNARKLSAQGAKQ
jgi:Spy/CpxP family protein refolding chaperone